jgi:hypothetical protein
MFLFTTMSKITLGHSHPMGTSRVMPLEHAAGNSPPANSKCKTVWSIIYAPPIHLNGIVLWHRENLLTFMEKR